ncbi:hypothetical protein [Phytohabitans aurantiacus]|nr:hypothetical protein [Phytohabitans aurantiacus]
MSEDLPAGRLVRHCVCGQPMHVGSVLATTSEQEGSYQAIVIRVGPMMAEPLHRVLDVVSLTRGQFLQHVGDLLHWQMEVGAPILCGSVGDIPPPCPNLAPGCQDERQLRLFWQSTYTPDLLGTPSA